MEVPTSDLEIRRTSAPCVDVECEAKESIIRAECVLAAPLAAHQAEFQKKIDEHKGRYPGGTLPCELRDFKDYLTRKKEALEHAEQERMKCLSLRAVPMDIVRSEIQALHR